MRPMFRLLSSLLLSSCVPFAPASAAVAANGLDDDDLRTVSERSGFLRTGRIAEVAALCDAFATRHPDRVRCTTFGETPG